MTTPLQQAAQAEIEVTKVRWEGDKLLATPKFLPQQSVEPVAYWVPKAEQFCMPPKDGTRPFARAWKPLYMHPPQQAKQVQPSDDLTLVYMVGLEKGKALRVKQVPMTNEEVLTLVPGLVDCLCDPYDKQRSGDDYSSVPVDMLRLARAIEAHHGIGGQP